MLWLEDVYSKVRRLPWSWNFKVSETQTGGDLYTTPIITSDPLVETWSWDKGTDTIRMNVTAPLTHTASLTVTNLHTGRYVYIGDEWYRCERIVSQEGSDGVITTFITLDKKIVSASATGQTLSFYRRNLPFKTNGIKSISIDDRKIENLTGEQIYRFKRGLDPRWYYGDSGESLAYHSDDYKIPAPPAGPDPDEITFLSTGTMDPGTHRLFYTFVDPETGQESAPSPTTEVVTTSTNNGIVITENPADTYWGISTYNRRLYISEVVDKYTRVPMYLVAEITTAPVIPVIPTTLITTHTSSDKGLSSKTSYYDGEWTNVCLYPAPDSYLRVHAKHIDTWHGLPDEEDIIKLGRQREFIDIFHLYFLMKQSIQNKDPTQFRQMQGAFREQLNFLLAQDGDDQRLDPSSWEYRFFSPTVNAITEEFTASLKYPF
tara:strand:+ start:254 stop:1549 length:1296 start_codon:yes stop_codon:yes gene_type:complete